MARPAVPPSAKALLLVCTKLQVLRELVVTTKQIVAVGRLFAPFIRRSVYIIIG